MLTRAAASRRRSCPRTLLAQLHLRPFAGEAVEVVDALVLVRPLVEPDRVAIDRQYQRNDAPEALSTFKQRRAETLAFLRGLKPEQWERGGIHPVRGRMTVTDFVGLMAWHDDNHLDQLKRALDGKA